VVGRSIVADGAGITDTEPIGTRRPGVWQVIGSGNADVEIEDLLGTSQVTQRWSAPKLCRL